MRGLHALRRLNALPGVDAAARFDNPYDTSLTARSRLRLRAGPWCNEGQIEQAFQHLYDSLERERVQPIGPGMLFNDLSAEAGYRVAVPVKEAGQSLSTLHYGDYTDIAAAYDRLLTHMAENGLNGSGVFMERYLLDSTHSACPSEFVTELSFDIDKVSRIMLCSSNKNGA